MIGSDQEMAEFYVVQERRATDFEVRKLTRVDRVLNFVELYVRAVNRMSLTLLFSIFILCLISGFFITQ